jgi:hypothetical protein
MKTAYERAMERLNKTTSVAKLTAKQKRQLAELDSKYGAKIAGREIALNDEAARATSEGDFEKAEKTRQQLSRERKAIQSELEEQKERIRADPAGK